MPEQSRNAAEDLVSNIMETITEAAQKKKSVSFFEEDKPVAEKIKNRLFGRQKPLHKLFGGGKCKLFFGLSTYTLSSYTF